MKRNKILITGTSRGLGEALASRFLEAEWEVHGFSRHKNETLRKSLKKKNLFKETVGDLSNLKDVRRFLKKSLMGLSEETCGQIVLINNAAILEPVKPIRECDTTEMLYNLKVNVLGSASLIHLFLQELNETSLPKLVMNVSSGAGQHPYHGWGNYCASKAALDMFCQCIALEELTATYPSKIFSIAPGVVDTQMQEIIRSKTSEEFAQIKKFIDLKEGGHLLDAAVVAGKFYRFITEMSSSYSNCVFNIHDLISD